MGRHPPGRARTSRRHLRRFPGRRDHIRSGHSIMSSISFIGLGGMARAIATRAVAGGNTVELIGRDASKARSLATKLGGGATATAVGIVPAGDIVVLAVPYTSAGQVVSHYGEALAGKIIIDISNTFTADAS